ncbi:hypothetical protein [Litoribrevibacter albus]|nr:hypothetical protein [Litoribrevibacter albus]
MKLVLKALMVGALGLMLTACIKSNIAPDTHLNSVSKKGIVVLSMDFPRGQTGPFILRFKNEESGAFGGLEVLKAGASSTWELAFKKYDFKENDLYGELKVVEFEPGVYRLSSWSVGKVEPNAVKEYRFHVEAGKITYLGNAFFKQNNPFSRSEANAPLAITIHTDKSERDIKALSGLYPNLDLNHLINLAPKNAETGFFKPEQDIEITIPVINAIVN